MKHGISLTRSPLAALTAVVACATALALAQAGGAVGYYTDPSGDGAGAPDITGVTIQSDAAGQLLFQLQVVDLPLPSDARTFLLLNTDMDVTTGAPDTGGADYYFSTDASDNTYWFARWDGADWAEAPYATVQVRTSSTGVRISVNRSELGDTEAFTFWTRTRVGLPEADQADTAPEQGSWHYSLASAGPAIEGVLVTTKPGFGPKAGASFTVTPLGLRLPEIVRQVIAPQPESYRCAAKLAGKALRGTGPNGCTWKLGGKARGKQLVVRLAVTYQGTTATFRFPYRVG